METRVRASPEQLLTLLEYMETHGDLARPLAGSQGRVRSDRLWTDLTHILNAVGGGVSKTTEKWKKVWADWKSKTKKKALSLRHHARGTGGGPASSQTLSASDERVLALMGVLAVEGQASVEELGFNIPQSSAQSNLVTQDNTIYLEVDGIVDDIPQLSLEPQPSHLPSQIQTPPPFPLVLAPPSAQEGQPAASPSPPAPPVLVAPSAPAPAPPTTPRRRRPAVPRASVTSPPGRRGPRLSAPATPQCASPERPRLRARRRRAPTPFERAAAEFTAVELRRLEMDESRTRLQHERDLRALEVEHERNQVLMSLVNVAQEWLNYYRSRDNTEPLNTE